MTQVGDRMEIVINDQGVFDVTDGGGGSEGDE